MHDLAMQALAGGGHGGGRIIILVLLLIIVALVVGWIVYARAEPGPVMTLSAARQPGSSGAVP